MAVLAARLSLAIAPALVELSWGLSGTPNIWTSRDAGYTASAGGEGMRGTGRWNLLSKCCLWSAVLALFAAAASAAPQVAIAQNAPAGPQSGAAPSEQPNQTSSASQSSAPNLAGTWKLNKEQSDNPQEKIQEAGGFGGRGGGMGRRRGGGGGGRMMSELSQLKIEQSASSVKITNSDGREIAQYSSSGSSSDSSGTAPAAEWHGAQLVSTTEGRRGGSVTRTFELSPDGKQLYMTTKIENPRLQQPVSIRFVYDSAKSSE
jgi:hypothetical protein